MGPTLQPVKRYPSVDEYLEDSDRWPVEIAALRPILLRSGLTEEVKWGKPCYSHEGKNIVILQEMNDFLALMFFKGALLKDTAGVLEDQGPNTRSARRMTVRSVEDVTALAKTIEDYVAEAMEVEEKGLEVAAAPEPELVGELRERLARDPELKAAFESLTPGRRREYNLHISSAKQSKTRADRVEKYVPKILARKGLRDR